MEAGRTPLRRADDFPGSRTKRDTNPCPSGHPAPYSASHSYQRRPADLFRHMNRGAPMTATAVLPRSAGPEVESRSPAPVSRAVAYQRVLHQLVRRELRLLADLSTWAPGADPARTQALPRHAELIGRVMLHHHRVERDLLWPALQ